MNRALLQTFKAPLLLATGLLLSGCSSIGGSQFFSQPALTTNSTGTAVKNAVMTNGKSLDLAPKGTYTNAPKGGFADKDYSQAALNKNEALALVNKYRASKGLKPLTLDKTLNKVAYLHSADLSKHDRISHYGSDGSNPWDRVSRSGYKPQLAAENVGTGQASLKEVFKGWQDSPGHNKNLLLPDAKNIGLAMVYNPKSEYKTFWTMILGTKL